VLIVLGAVLYWSVATTLAAQSVNQLKSRAADIQGKVEFAPNMKPTYPFPIMVTADPGLLGAAIGGPASGTIAVALDPNGTPGAGIAAGPSGTANAIMVPMPDPDTVAAARGGAQVVRETDMSGTPVRTLTTAAGSNFVVQIIADRTAEVRTLGTLLLVLVAGGLAVVVAAMAVGYVYAGGALVPIRESLRRQREFAADASHELRTPLAIIRSGIDQLRRHRTDPTSLDRTLDDIEVGADRLNRLVDDLLLLARTDADAVELAMTGNDLGELATDAAADLSSVAEGQGVHLRLDVEPAPVQGDSGRLRQLVGILVDNALRHSPTGAAVTVRVRPGASLEVEDDGPGIRDEDLTHVFDRFWRAADAPAGGTGLGLAIAQWIARQHRGQLWVENRAEGGARFRLSLPGA
jgi:two-component system, OmpR family, sensor histidine kinase CiaH